MCPIYAVLAAPLARPLGVRVLLWYAQWHRTRTLDLAARLSTAVVSVDRSTIPIASSRAVGIGHGIDMSLFTCGSGTGTVAPFEVVALGRYAESKGLEAIVRAIAIARARGADVLLTCHGTATGASDEETRAGLERLVGELGLGEAVTLGGPIARSEVPALLARSSALVNNTRSGAPDKVVFEACASCLPVLLSSPPLRSLVDGLGATLFFPTDDAERLGDALAALATTDPAARVAIGIRLRERVHATHSTDSWADAITRLARGQPPVEAPA
jgi:glycosyltransferase involved in cell wall biosynthesis